MYDSGDTSLESKLFLFDSRGSVPLPIDEDQLSCSNLGACDVSQTATRSGRHRPPLRPPYETHFGEGTDL